jgi:3'-phosphoadenosine 5'-phosphosulfate (PAPS) 3'-phosphatase
MAALLIIAVTGVCAQTAGRRAVMATSTDADSRTADMRAKAEVNQRMVEMETTLGRMHLLLKQMQASAAVKNSKDPVTKANLEMWGLMIQQLDKQFDQLKVTARERADLSARRAAMYQQAEQRAAQMRNAQGQTPPNVTTAQPAGAKAAQGAQSPESSPAPASSPHK